MRDRRVWVVIGVVAAVLAVMLIVWARGGSDDAEVAGAPTPVATPSASLGGLPSATPTGSAPAPSGSATETGAATTGGSPSGSGSSSAEATPAPDSSIAADGLPVVTIDSPEPGASVRLPLQLGGTAVAFEAVLRWEVVDTKGKVIANGPAYADAGAPERGRWQVEVELPLGSYTARAWIVSQKDGHRVGQTAVKFSAG